MERELRQGRPARLLGQGQQPIANAGRPVPQPNKHYVGTYVTGQWLSMLGDSVAYTALAWWTALLHHAPQLLGWLTASEGLPMAGAFLAGGWLSDRFGALRMVGVADALRLVAMLSIGIAFASDHTSLLVLGPLFAVVGVGSGLFYPANGSVAPVIAGGELIRANRLLSLAERSTSLIGPPLAAAGVALLPIALLFVVNGLTYLASIVSAVWLAVRFSGQRSGYPFVRRPLGIRQALGDDRVRALLLLSLLASGICNALLAVGIPVYVSGHGSRAVILSSLLVAYGLGAVIGTTFSGKHRLLRPAIVPAFMGLVALLFGTLVLVPYPEALGVLFLIGVVWGAEAVLYRTLIQVSVTRSLLGRVIALSALCSMGGAAIWQAIAGETAATYGPPALLIGLPTIALATALIVLIWIRRLHVEPYEVVAGG